MMGQKLLKRIHRSQSKQLGVSYHNHAPGGAVLQAEVDHCVWPGPSNNGRTLGGPEAHPTVAFRPQAEATWGSRPKFSGAHRA